VVQAVGENQALHLVIFLDAVVLPGGIDDPVSYVYQIQQIPELLFRQFDLHGADTSQIDDTVTIIAETYAEFHIKNRAKRLKSVLRQKAPHSIICNPDAK